MSIESDLRRIEIMQDMYSTFKRIKRIISREVNLDRTCDKINKKCDKMIKLYETEC